MIDENLIREFLRTSSKGNLHHREGQELEFKEQFNLVGLADYFKDFYSPAASPAKDSAAVQFFLYFP